ncbi:LysR family transcriptional regulator [Thalassovita sp.]|jgi:LysR family glycine cleavage system transcriptional activator|uniref:LysR family transcriptional regulator n=1 Tax=Thalassovita sp. TaxID=1979401 RepID=UPI003B5BE184
MKTALPPLTWFRSFEAAARTLSFTAAGAEIGMTQSAVSQQIKALETRLRVPLFRRLPRGLALTDAGRKLLPEVEAALAMLAAATETHLAPASENSLTIAASVSMIEWVISPALPQFQALHPHAKIGLRATIWPDEYNAPKADIELRFGSAKQVGAGGIVLPNSLVAVRAPGMTARIDEAPLIQSVGTSVGWKNWGQLVGLAGLKPSISVDSYGTALKLAMDGAGIALVNRIVARHALKTGAVELANPTSIPGHEGYFLSQLSDRPLVSAFSDWFQTLI